MAKQDKLREQFRHEAKIMAGLNHPSITKAFDFIENETEGLYAIVMELIDGENLSDIAKQNGAFSQEQTNHIMLKVLDAFAYTHGKGLVHYNVKPSNIYLWKDKSIKILGFGITRAPEQNEESTRMNLQTGAAAYMSPEQLILSKQVDYLSNIYSLGILMDFMLTGKVPYGATNKSNHAIFKEIIETPLPEAGKHLRHTNLIRKATALKPEERFESYEEFTKQLIDAKNKAKKKLIVTHKVQKSTNKNNGSYQKDNTFLIPLIIVITIVLLVWIPWYVNTYEKQEENTSRTVDSVTV